MIFMICPFALFAADGALEINQLCVATGCFAGDTPGLPVTLNQEGRSYVLTSDLQQTGTSDVIDIVARGITLDLQGHAIRGPVICNGSTPTSPVTNCDNDPGAGTGIRAQNAGSQGLTVRNGGVYGMPRFCIDIFFQAGIRASDNLVEDMKVGDCGAGGIFAEGSVVRNVTVSRASDNGIVVRDDGLVIGSRVTRSGARGVFGGFCVDTVSVNNAMADSCNPPSTRVQELSPTDSTIRDARD
jgi:hypothetical protein